MMVDPARTQTKLIVYVFSSVILLVLIIALAYKYGYSNLFSASAPTLTPDSQLEQIRPIEIEMVPMNASATAGEPITYQLRSKEDVSFLGFSLKLQSTATAAELTVPETFTVNVPGATTPINRVIQEEGTVAELVFLTLSTTTPLSLSSGESFAELTVTPTSAGSVQFDADQEASFITMIEDETRPIVFNFERVIVLE